MIWYWKNNVPYFCPGFPLRVGQPVTCALKVGEDRMERAVGETRTINVTIDPSEVATAQVSVLYGHQNGWIRKLEREEKFRKVNLLYWIKEFNLNVWCFSIYTCTCTWSCADMIIYIHVYSILFKNSFKIKDAMEVKFNCLAPGMKVATRVMKVKLFSA